MDSPKTNEIGAKSPPLQESPFTSYVSTLSPINQTAVLRVGQRFPEINLTSPPPVFMSPRETTREAKDKKGSQDSHSSDPKFSSNFKDREKVKTTPVIPQSSGTQPKAHVITQSETNKNKSSAEVQSCSPSGCVDEYLIDLSEECVDSAGSPHFPSKKAHDLPQAIESGSNSSHNIMGKRVLSEKMPKDSTVGSSNLNLARETQNNESQVVEKAVNVKKIVAESGQVQIGSLERVADERLSEERSCLTSKDASGAMVVDSCTDCITDKEHDQEHAWAVTHQEHNISEDNTKLPTLSSDLREEGKKVDLELAGEDSFAGDWHDNSQMQPESYKIHLIDCVNNETVDSVSIGTVRNQMSHDCEEASQLPRGTRRRCLQFEAAEIQKKCMRNSSNSWDPSRIPPNVCSPASPMQPEDLNILSQEESNSFSTDKPVVKLSHASSRLQFCSAETSEIYTSNVENTVQNRGNSPVAAPISLGIGLHLNNIGKDVGIGSGVQGEKLFPGQSFHLPGNSKALLVQSSSVVNFSAKGNVSADSPMSFSAPDAELDQQRCQALVVRNSSSNIKASLHEIKSLDHSQHLSLGQALVPYEKQMLAGHDTGKFEELNQTSPKKKRHRATPIVENEGCKRCNCKKSKCLKLYCECFAAGVYCAEPCTCQECFNKPEYEDTVLGTRQQIESRNPLAFAPKVVQRITESPQNSGEDGNWTTPASARHKRGCNCKKSLCLKKYCECYQAGVGCSEGCRCEGCKNIFGKKEGCSGITGLEHRKAEEERWVKEVPRKVEVRRDLLHPEANRDMLRKEHSHSDLSPPTPFVQGCSLGKDVPKIQYPSRRHLTSSSPESESSALCSFGKSPKSPGTSNINVSFARARDGFGTQSRELDCHMAAKFDHFSPRWEGYADLYDISPSAHYHHSGSGASASSDSTYYHKGVHAPVTHGNIHLSGGAPLKWRSSPVTPAAHIGGTKFVIEPDKDRGLCNTPEDETPDILKETHSPTKAVKVSSPNQKRVSPPHNRLKELRSSSSPVKSGRKFILQSVPPFPSLTPYSEPKGSEK
ncbi:hypothetical protein H6P81_004207 [Aristolochia fimbriata]|uniref:CRC domain-containing protein n=1 Tax=Aristolochia fimbriata TaxID=158543 RepID=A0AAV7FGK9_ARIFI|nr:hypothetical protein H6P81_004207 [Aristolochia fimbriata]